ncbi:MAG: HAD family phosphatase [Armatimonadota bacterium]|nr:HAD family phosphatase [Armatimonadota bacterium]
MNVPGASTAVVFDMDGVLVDSEPIHFDVARRLLAPAGVTITREMSQNFVGRSVVEFLTEAMERFRLPGTLAEYRARYDTLLFEALARPIPPRDGAVWLIDQLRQRGCAIGLASTSKRGWIDAMLRATALEGRFDAIVGGDMVERVKPAPDVYLAAAARLAVEPAACVAIEDSPLGIEAARAARMRVVGLITPHVDPLALQQADVLIASLREFPFALLGDGACACSPSAPSGTEDA